MPAWAAGTFCWPARLSGGPRLKRLVGRRVPRGEATQAEADRNVGLDAGEGGKLSQLRSAACVSLGTRQHGCPGLFRAAPGLTRERGPEGPHCGALVGPVETGVPPAPRPSPECTAHAWRTRSPRALLRSAVPRCPARRPLAAPRLTPGTRASSQVLPPPTPQPPRARSVRTGGPPAAPGQLGVLRLPSHLEREAAADSAARVASQEYSWRLTGLGTPQ